MDLNWYRPSLLLLGLLTAELVLGHTSEPVYKQGGGNVEKDKDPEETEVAPAVAVAAADAREEGVGVCNGTELASRRGVGILKFTSHDVDVVFHILPACLIGRRLEMEQFVVCANDGSIGYARGEHT